MKYIIVDDDEMARASLASMCEKIAEIDLVGIFDNGLSALECLKNNAVDLIFLDIQMPDLSGIDLVKTFDNLPQIIFTTSHSEYALEAFEHQVTDFLVKPVEFPRLMKAVERAKKMGGKTTVGGSKIGEIYVKVDGRFVRLALEDILYIESLGDYVTFKTDTEKFIVHSTLKNIDEKIHHPDFLKVHRSYIVNLSKVVDIEDTNLVIKDKIIPISRAHKPVLMSRIKTI
ncbi:MAG: LytR/AlgR family response regulator transcription factor [Bacteroidota bacterium]